MQFSRQLHEPIRAGVVTCSVRIWKRPHVKSGGRYKLGQGPGYIVVDAIDEIALEDINEALAIASGFESVADLMKTARHGSGETIYLIHFHYVDCDLT